MPKPSGPPGPRLSGGSARALGTPQFPGGPGMPGASHGHPGGNGPGGPFPFGGPTQHMMQGGRPGMPPGGMPYGLPQGMPGMTAGFVPGGPGGMNMNMAMGGMGGPGSPFGGPGAPVRLSPGPGQPGGPPKTPPGNALVLTQRKSSAIRIVNPDSKEEVKGDYKPPEKKEDKAEGEDKKPAATPPAAPLAAAAAAAAAGARPAPGGYPGMAPNAQGFSPYGGPPQPMMGAPGTSPGGPTDGFSTGFTAGSPDGGDPAFVAAQAAQAMAAAGMTPPGPGGPAPPRPAMPAPAAARPSPSPATPKHVPPPAAPKEDPTPAAPLEMAMKSLSVEEKAPAKEPVETKAPEEKKAEEKVDTPVEEAPAPGGDPNWKPPTEGAPAPGETKKYTLEFLKGYEQAPMCASKPGDLETPDDVDYWPLVDFVVPPGFGGGGGGGRRGGRGGGPQWNGPPGGGGGRGGRGGGGKWGHTGLPPDQQGDGRGGRGGGGFRNYGAPVSNRADPRLPQLVQTENKFVAIDKSTWDAEEKKQRGFKGILNKLTPESFEKLLEKILEEGIDEAQTLMGLIGQLFDKALTEPTFAELYATMCAALSDRFLAEGVEFKDPASPDPENPVVITFKRVLLSKCQEEFEKGDGAIKAAEKEALEAAELKARKEAGEVVEEPEPEPEEEKEEGEAPKKPKTPEELDLDERRKVHEREERMRQARRRMLGNIRFIGELFKKQMLSERIMHTCIQKLLSDPEKPDEEDVEALCKLLSTIGGQLDHQKAKSHMDAYANRILGLSKNQTISSRHRFMCQDVLEMRSKGWRERRKQEGPKKIGDVHRDAQREASNQARGGPPRGGGRDDRGPPNRGGDRGGGRDFGPPGGRDSGRDGDRGGGRDGGRGGRDGGRAPADGPPRATRGAVSGGRLAPSGRDGSGRGDKNANAPAPKGGIPGPKEGKGNAKEEKTEKPAEESKESTPVAMSDEEYETERKRTLEYFFDDKDAREAISSIHKWSGFQPRVPEFVQNLIVTGFERRQMDWDAAAKLFRLLPQGVGGPANADGLVAGLKLVLDDLEDLKCDMPLADAHLATLLAGPVADGAVGFKAIADACSEAGPEGEIGYLKEEGGALYVLVKVLAKIAQSFGTPRAERVLTDSGVDLTEFIGELDKEDGVTVQTAMEKNGLAGLPIIGSLDALNAKLAEADATGDAIASWIDSEATPSSRISTEFVGKVTRWALKSVPSDVSSSSPIAALEQTFVALKAAVKGPEQTDDEKSKSQIGKEEREVTVLYAAQRLCAEREFPEGLLERVFRDLHAGDVLDETAMKAWRDDTSNAIGLEKINGKEKALFQCMELLQEFASDDEGETEVEA